MADRTQERVRGMHASIEAIYRDYFRDLDKAREEGDRPAIEEAETLMQALEVKPVKAREITLALGGPSLRLYAIYDWQGRVEQAWTVASWIGADDSRHDVRRGTALWRLAEQEGPR